MESGCSYHEGYDEIVLGQGLNVLSLEKAVLAGNAHQCVAREDVQLHPSQCNGPAALFCCSCKIRNHGYVNSEQQ